MNKLTAFAFPALLIASAIACVTGTISDDVSISESIAIPAVTPLMVGSVQLPEQSFPLDVSGAMSDLAKIGALSLTVKHNVLSGSDAEIVQNVVIGIAPTDGSMQAIETSGAGGAEMPVDTAALLKVLSEGPVTLTVTMTVDASKLSTEASTLNYDLEVSADLKVKK
jgi:hypothetical protein